MKHTAVLYTCVGLMGAAALAGFIDYSSASKQGLLTGLYQEEAGSALLQNEKKKVALEDYSRGPIEEYSAPDDLVTATTDEPKKKASKKLIPPPPPAPDAPPSPLIVEDNVLPPPPAKPAVPTIVLAEPVPPVEPVKGLAPTPVIDSLPGIEEKAPIRLESFSRAPLKKKIVATKRKQ